MILYKGKISIIRKDNGKLYWDFTELSDFKKTMMLACRKYGIKSRKKRIRMKYLKKLMDEALSQALKDLDESQT